MSFIPNTAIDAYIAKQPEWQRTILRKLRSIIHAADPEIKETIKWGAPTFENHGNVVWMFCVSEWIHFSFPQGALLDPSHGLFEEGKDSISKVKRTIKFIRDQHIPEDILITLIKEAVANNRAGKKISFVVAKAGGEGFDVPIEYADFLREHKLYEDYKNRAFYQQRGWIQWIESAKQEETRQKRARIMIRELQNGQYMPVKAERK